VYHRVAVNVAAASTWFAATLDTRSGAVVAALAAGAPMRVRGMDSAATSTPIFESLFIRSPAVKAVARGER